MACGYGSLPFTEMVCDELDNNCNSQTDEGLTFTYYRDADEDTYGDLNNTTDACSLPIGYVKVTSKNYSCKLFSKYQEGG